ncbi:male sterility protein [Phlyctema vagabunda]|uniref:Male sterility protein n=1 Tax=Phlyctema vagabunda TaxID=108571 RepID=A0ABR4PE44_9HELO
MFPLEPLRTIDDLLISRCNVTPDIPLVAYPSTTRGTSDYVHYTAKELDRFTHEAAEIYHSLGLNQPSENQVVAVLAPSDLDYVTSLFALSRLGFSILLLSNRLATEAYVSLLQQTNCSHLVYSGSYQKLASDIKAEIVVTLYPITTHAQYNLANPSSIRTSYQVPDPSTFGTDRVAFITHSSGSTGLPKAILQTHKKCLIGYSSKFEYRPFLTMPLYHNHGLFTFFRSIYNGKEIALYNANLPLSGSNLIEAIEAVKPDSFHGVPFALKVLAETDIGIQALRRCKLVLFGGSSCPDEIGDRLTEAGVYLVGHYGATEVGQLMTSFRPPDDKAWNYLRPVPTAKPYISMVERATGSFECVVLDGLISKVMSNSNDPPLSFHTSDLFSPHRSIADAWKYLGRFDDRVTLVSGEKVLPISYEHHIRDAKLVKEACVFGVGRALPGLIIIPSDHATGMSKESLLAHLWPVIQVANSRTEEFGRVSKDLVMILDIGTEYPATDKGTLKRAAFYKKFDDLINGAYDLIDAPTAHEGLVLNGQQIEEYLLKLFVDIGIEGDLYPSSEFFEIGVDSLKAIAARGKIMRELELGSQVLGQNVVYDYPNISSLASHLYSLRTGEGSTYRDEVDVMRTLLDRYSKFKPHIPGSSMVESETIILTGATGSLGIHLLAKIMLQPNIKKIYCLVRAGSPDSARDRITEALAAKGFLIGNSLDKITCLPCDLSKEDLGINQESIKILRASLTTIIHNAWAVNWNLGVQGFEQQHIKGTVNLLNFCLSVTTPLPARLFFCSSGSVAAGTPLPAIIQEDYIENLSYAQNMGYARSKLVTELIIKAVGVSSLLEHCQISMRLTHSWIPVDLAAQSILEVIGLVSSPSIDRGQKHPYTVFHIKNTQTVHWADDILPALRESGLEFETIPPKEWIERLRCSGMDLEPEKNPTIKLLDFFAKKYEKDHEAGKNVLQFVTEETGKRSKTIHSGYNVVKSGLLKKFIQSWQAEGW